MASQGPNSGSNFSSANENGSGSNAWTNPGSAAASDGLYANGTPSTQWLKATGFGFSIPSGSTIDGILVEVQGRKASGSPAGTRVQLLSNGFVGAYQNVTWTTTEQYYVYGGSADLWSLSWTADQINAADFGAGIWGAVGAVATLVNHIRITVYYTPPTGYSFAQVMG